MSGFVHVSSRYAVRAVVALHQHTSGVHTDLQRRQVGDVLQFALEFGQLVLQLLLVSVQLQQLGCEGSRIFSSWSVGCSCSEQVHKQLLVALHPLIQLLYILVLSNI